jgi:transposase
MCPGNQESAGKRKSGKTRKGNVWLRAALIEAAHALGRGRGTYLAAHASYGVGTVRSARCSRKRG